MKTNNVSSGSITNALAERLTDHSSVERAGLPSTPSEWSAAFHDSLFSTRGRFILAVALVALALALTLTLQHVATGRPSLFLFFAAIVAAAWFGGLWAGVLAAGLSVPPGVYFYWTAQASHSLTIDNLVMLFFFGACAGVGGFLNSQQRAATETLRRTHREIEIKADALQASNSSLTAQIAERVRAEDALRDAQSELVRISRLTTIGHLSASIAHEVNQPLTAVISNAGSCVRWLDASPPNLEEAKSAAHRIIRDSERASAIISNIRTMVRRGLPEKVHLDINEIIARVLHLTREEIDLHRISISAELGSGVPTLLGDPIQLQQLFLNIILNAIEAMSGAVQERTLFLRTLIEGESLLVLIADNGPGIPPDILGRQFEAFVTSKPEGMGLGLSICRTIVEAHGGVITASPGLSSGTVFRLAFPLNED